MIQLWISHALTLALAISTERMSVAAISGCDTTQRIEPIILVLEKRKRLTCTACAGAREYSLRRHDGRDPPTEDIEEQA